MAPAPQQGLTVINKVIKTYIIVNAESCEVPAEGAGNKVSNYIEQQQILKGQCHEIFCHFFIS